MEIYCVSAKRSADAPTIFRQSYIKINAAWSDKPSIWCRTNDTLGFALGTSSCTYFFGKGGEIMLFFKTDFYTFRKMEVHPIQNILLHFLIIFLYFWKVKEKYIFYQKDLWIISKTLPEYWVHNSNHHPWQITLLWRWNDIHVWLESKVVNNLWS